MTDLYWLAQTIDQALAPHHAMIHRGEAIKQRGACGAGSLDAVLRLFIPIMTRIGVDRGRKYIAVRRQIA